MNDNGFMDLLENRRSLRSYQKKKIEPEILFKVLDAGQQAPTASNRRELRLLVFEKELPRIRKALIDSYREWMRNKSKEELTEAFGGIAAYFDKWNFIIREYDSNGKDGVFFEAPALIVIAGPEEMLLDAGICGQNMVLMAQTLGLGSCYIGFVRRATGFSELFREALGLSESENVLLSFVLGYPDTPHLRKIKKQPFEVVVK